MEEVLLSSSIDVLVRNLELAVEEEKKFAFGVDKELRYLLSSASAIRSVVADAEKKQQTSKSVKRWLLQLKDAAYDAEDVIEEFKTQALEAKLNDDGDYNLSQKSQEPEREEAKPTLRKKVMTLCFCFPTGEVGLGDRIKRSRRKFSTIKKESKRCKLRESDDERLPKLSLQQMQNLLEAESAMIGREAEKDELVSLLLSKEWMGRRPSVIPIVAPAGVGKTTLARIILACREVRKHFPRRFWFCASPDLNLDKVSREVLISSTGYDEDTEEKTRLKALLKKKRFLLVLDNVSEENRNLDRILAPFTSGHKEGVILLTTRSEKVASSLGTTPPYYLSGLSGEHCLSLLIMRMAFASEEEFRAHPNLEEAGLRIVEKCEGVPLAVKTIGGLLAGNTNPTVWENVLNSPLWDRAQKDSDIHPALRVGYHHLPSKVKKCFQVCSLLPREYVFEAEELIELWIGEGHILSEDCEHLEIGKGIFLHFLLRGFFCLDSYWRGRPKFKMHDVAHALADSLAKEEVRLEEDMPILLPQRTRHSSLVCYKEVPKVNLDALSSCKTLRSFLYVDLFHDKRQNDDDLPVFAVFPNDQLSLLLRCKSLLVLGLQGCMIRELPDSFDCLKLLRFLDLSYTLIRNLPDSICRLYLLETLNLRHCIHLHQLPKNLSNLSNLRFLYLEECHSFRPGTTPRIGKLRKLQTLPRFDVKNEDGFRISELKEMADLKGEMVIFSLQNVGSGEEAKEANMKNKPHIHELHLQWAPFFLSGPRDSKLDEQVLDALEPHVNLQGLSIIGYQGEHLPNWLPNLVGLQGLVLNSCPNLASLPENGLPTSLQSLRIVWCPLLQKRCEKETGEDWPKIAHIPNVFVTEE